MSWTSIASSGSSRRAGERSPPASPRRRPTMLREALALWRGEPLADFAYDSFAQGEIGRLDELRLGAVEERLDADLALGRHDDVTAELQGLVAEHPLRERLSRPAHAGPVSLGPKGGRVACLRRGTPHVRRGAGARARAKACSACSARCSPTTRRWPRRCGLHRGPRRKNLRRRRRRCSRGRRGALLGVGGALLLAAALAVAAARRHARPNVRRHRLRPAGLAGPDRPGDEQRRGRDSRRCPAGDRCVRTRRAVGGEPGRRQRLAYRPAVPARGQADSDRHSRRSASPAGPRRRLGDRRRRLRPPHRPVLQPRDVERIRTGRLGTVAGRA